MPLWINIIYWCAAGLTIIRTLPQIYVTVAKKQISNLSISSQLFYIVGCGLWIIYSIAFFDTLGWATLLVNIFALAISLFLVFYILILKKSNKKSNIIVDTPQTLSVLEMKIKIAMLVEKDQI
ncbi:PQ-loop domain-containing transporter [Spiroplasma endosymbiont of Aspidapion aeneum]|uniref:PQ-loop domain-containing transporter n=1 Tax=Spiroplasma endosymbiont of Aspidapion aeneum TaxID=3066276 RepID=UPI00313B658D